MTVPGPPFGIDAYLRRIGYTGERSASRDVLQALHECHVASIPFENIDVRLGRPILLDLDSLEAKLVGARRGGYCFEQNTLFCAALRELGFAVETLEARVRPAAATNVLPRTHMVLRVLAEGGAYLADVGFGADGPIWPVAFDGEESVQPGGSFRLAPGGSWTVLQTGEKGSWMDLYAVSGEPVLPVDYEVANHYTSTHPKSTFVRSLTVQQSTREVRRILRGRTFTVKRDGVAEAREVLLEEIPGLLRGVFGLDLPDSEILSAAGES